MSRVPVHRQIHVVDLPETEQHQLARYLARQTGLTFEQAMVELRRQGR
jgi:hypothetical protein